MNQDLQFIWQPEFSFEQDTQLNGAENRSIFAHMLYDHYNAPSFVNRKFYVDGNYSESAAPSRNDNMKWYEYFEN